jgi:hypothetical protein
MSKHLRLATPLDSTDPVQHGWFRVNLILPDRRRLMADITAHVFRHEFMIGRLLAGAFGSVASIGMEIYGPLAAFPELMEDIKGERRNAKQKVGGDKLRSGAAIRPAHAVQMWRLRVDGVLRARLLADLSTLLSERANMVFLQTIRTGRLHFNLARAKDGSSNEFSHLEMHLQIVDAATAEMLDRDIAKRSVAWSIAGHTLRPLYPTAHN